MVEKIVSQHEHISAIVGPNTKIVEVLYRLVDVALAHAHQRVHLAVLNRQEGTLCDNAVSQVFKITFVYKAIQVFFLSSAINNSNENQI